MAQLTSKCIKKKNIPYICSVYILTSKISTSITFQDHFLSLIYLDNFYDKVQYTFLNHSMCWFSINLNTKINYPSQVKPGFSCKLRIQHFLTPFYKQTNQISHNFT